MTPLTPVLSRFWDEPEPWSMDTYRRHDGYQALERALGMSPDDVKVASEAIKDQAAPAPSADVPAKPNEPETDPDATESKT